MGETEWTQDLALLIGQAAEQRGGLDVTVLDMRELMAICDYFVICHGRSRAHLRAIAEAIEERLERDQTRVQHREGPRDDTWMILDYGPVVVHIFSEAGRDFYALERLWIDAVRVELPAQA